MRLLASAEDGNNKKQVSRMMIAAWDQNEDSGRSKSLHQNMTNPSDSINDTDKSD
jgi:hypothetical protein